MSLMEGGKRVTVPTALLYFLVKKGFNLNLLFDDNVSVKEFLDYKPDPDLTGALASRDAMIRTLQERIVEQKQNIEVLRSAMEIQSKLLRNLQKKTPVIIEIAGVTC